MPNIELLEKSMPVAPIRIAALEGCRELAERRLFYRGVRMSAFRYR